MAYTSGEVTAGIYLVSACGSAEEFVAAFRRYVDKTGLFIPIASPLPQGKRGRFALTLADGGVMLEGDAEILQSSPKSPLHGRAGIQLKFLDLDDASKTVLAELEKARLAMKPAPISVPPRQGNVPASPRPTPPAVGGRIDAANALAECVAIGDASKLEDAGPPKAGPKFVVPSIPALGGPGARPKTPSTPPEGISTPAVGKLTTMGMPALRPPADSGPVKVEPTRADPTPPPARKDATPPPTAARKDPTPPPAAARKDPTPPPAAARTATLRDAAGAMQPVPKSTAAFESGWGDEEAAPAAPMAKTGSAPSGAPAAPMAKTGSAPSGAPAAPMAKSGSAPSGAPAAPMAKSGSAPSGATKAPTAADNGGLPPPKAPSKTKMTQIGFPVVKLPADGTPKATSLGVVPLRADEPPPTPAPPKLPPQPDKPAKPPLPQPTPTRTKSPTAPPRNPTPHVPLPVAKLPAKPAPLLAEDVADEKTDLTSTPLDPNDAAIVVDSKPPSDEPAPEPKPQRSGGMRASEIMAAVTGDDWTMTPDASSPTVLPSDQRAPAIEEPTPGPTPTGDWTMSLDPAAGWSKPEQVATPLADKPTKIERPKPAIQTPATGNPVKSVSSDKPIEVQAWEDKPTSIGEKIEIDATLMEPAEPMPAFDVEEARPGNGSGSFGALPEQMAPASGLAAASSGGMNVSPYGSAPGMPMMSPGGFDAMHGPSAATSEPALPLPPPPVPPLPQEIPIGYAPTLLPGQMTAPPLAPPPPVMPLQYATAQPGDLYRSEAMPVLPSRSNKRLLVIAAAVVLVVGAAIVLALTMGHGKKKPLAEQHAGSAAVVMMSGSGSAQPAVGSGAAQQAVVMPDAAVVEPPPIDAAAQEAVVVPPKSDTCNVEVATTPAGAEVSLEDKTVLGTTPAKLTLPCGKATKLTIKKPKFLAVIRSVTPTPEGVKVAVTLGVATFALKITSTPAGATIFVGGRSKGVTPTAVQLPAFQTVKITVAKDGYAPDTSNIVMKSNGQSHHVTLRKAGRRSSSDSHGLKGI